MSPKRPVSHDLAEWACTTSGILLAGTAIIALVAGADFLTKLGFGIPALVVGIALLLLRDRVSLGEPRFAMGAAALVILHGLWTLVRVTSSGGDPSIAVWTVRLLLVALMLFPAASRLFRSNRVGTETSSAGG